MQRRHFIQISALGAAGLLAVRPDVQATTPSTRIALVAGASLMSDERRPRIIESMAGAATMLRESGLPYDLVNQEVDFSPYQVLVLPDEVLFSLSFKEKMETYLQRGGGLLASFRSGLTLDGAQFATPALGVERVGEARYSPDFIDTSGSVLRHNLASPELTMYLRGVEVLPTGATVLASTTPLFEGADNHPAITEYGKVIYFMHPIFTQYHRSAPRWCRQLVLNALDRLVVDISDAKIAGAIQ